ncbi:hotdog fold thioesterase [Bradyrhizobium sp. SZCCHNRI1073]|uniref:hotdog fold thioesterase n=1 Tax=Bradyrhizobium sp. SZCCHNRI1073 TaxID=3057280 RepID=UPI0039670A86
MQRRARPGRHAQRAGLAALQSDLLGAWRLHRDPAGFRDGARRPTMCPQGSGYTTREFKVSFIKAMTETTGIVRTEGRTLSFGRRAATAEARIADSQGRLLAHATTTCLVLELPKA